MTTAVDTITEFSGAAGDSIDLAVAGTAANYAEIDGSGYANLAAAVAAIDSTGADDYFPAAADGKLYALVYNIAGSGNSYLIADENDAGAADGAVYLEGVGQSTFEWAFIV